SYGDWSSDVCSSDLWMSDSELNGHSLVAVAVGLYPVVRNVYASRPDLSLRSRAVVEAVFLSGGSIGTAQQVAPYLGLHNRFELADRKSVVEGKHGVA